MRSPELLTHPWAFQRSAAGQVGGYANQPVHPCRARHILLQDGTKVHSAPVPANM
jgi:hypothetical protein